MFFRWLRERKIRKLQREVVKLEAELAELRRNGYGNDNIAGLLAVAQYDLNRLMEKL